jgi:hypothetical protein
MTEARVESGAGLGDLASRAVSYVNQRFPLQSLGVAVGVTFLCAYLVYGHAFGHQSFGLRTVLGVLTFVVLFLQLRIVDDLDDVESARAPGDSDAQVRRRKLELIAGLAATTLLIVAMNWNSPALVVALAATALMIVNPFVLKNGVKAYITKPSDPGALTTGSVAMDLVLAIFYEGVPVLMVVYIYYAWTAVAKSSVPASLVLVVTATFWALYEIWKYARYLTRPDWRPYGLGWTGARVLLVGLFAIAALFQVLTARLAGLSPVYSVYAVLLTGVFVAFVWRTQPSAEKDKRAKLRALAGLAYVGAVDLGILLAVAASR